MASLRMLSLAVVGLVLAANLHFSDAQAGVFYGGLGDNLPTPAEILDIIAKNNIQKLRLLEPNHEILSGLKGKNVEVFLGVSNKNITPFSTNPALAEQWVQVNVKPYLPDVKIKYIVLGNDMSRNSDMNQFSFFMNITMVNLYNAIQNQGLKDVKLTTAIDTSVMDGANTNALPSTAALFPESRETIVPVLKVISASGAPLLVNLYPYYELARHPTEINPDFALFEAADHVLTDGKLSYQNKLDAMLDTFYTILEKEGYPSMEIVVGETGWPSAGGVLATVEKAKRYSTNLVKHLGKGTPKRPNKPIQAFLNLFDENQRSRPEVDKHFGLFTADKQMKFPLDLNSYEQPAVKPKNQDL